MPYLLLPWAAAGARPRILDKVEAQIGPGILIFTSTFFIKEPHSADHRGVASGFDLLWPGTQGRGYGLIALTEASEAAGCMDALSFQGRPRQLSHVSRVVKDSVNRAGQVITEPLDDSTPVAMPLSRAGLAASWTVPHRSGPNTSSHRRIGLGRAHPDPYPAVGSTGRPRCCPRHDPLRAFRARRLAEGRAGRKRTEGACAP